VAGEPPGGGTGATGATDPDQAALDL
jgi:hypothetical protein